MFMISPDSFVSRVSGLLARAGLSADHAAVVADVFLRASLRGVGHHDLASLPQRLDWLCNHGVNPRPQMVRTGSHGALESWDADAALGELACATITRRAMELAAVHGCAVVGTRRSNHFLAAAPYCEMGAQAGYLLLIWSNTDATMHAPGGKRAVLGNNPFGCGVPADGGNWVLDICMAYASLGNLAALRDQGERVPHSWGIDARGQAIDDPAAILDGGALSPIGGHKGFGLALLGEAMTGLAMAGTSGDQVVAGGGINTHNQTVLAIDTRHLPAGQQGFASAAADLSARLREAQPGLRLPGERSSAAAAAARSRGIAVPDALLASLQEWSKRLGTEAFA